MKIKTTTTAHEDAIIKYMAALDSVSLINRGKPTSMSDEDWADTVSRNKEHLINYLSKLLDGNSSFDLTTLKAAVEKPDSPPPVETVQNFIAADLLALLTSDDHNKIVQVLKANPKMRSLWSELVTRGDSPIPVNSPKFTSGLTGLTAALGSARVTKLFTVLNITL